MKRWGKRVTALCLTAGMVMLTGCSAAQPEKAADTTTAAATGDTAAPATEKGAAENTDAAGQEVSFRYEWWGGSATHEAYTNLQAAYKELHPEVTIDME